MSANKRVSFEVHESHVVIWEIDSVLASDDILKNHIEDCHYYGIPTYIGKDEKLKERIKRLEDLLPKSEE